MNAQELTAMLDRLRREPHETERLKSKGNHYEPQVFGEYFPALTSAAFLTRKLGVAYREEARHLTKENHV